MSFKKFLNDLPLSSLEKIIDFLYWFELYCIKNTLNCLRCDLKYTLSVNINDFKDVLYDIKSAFGSTSVIFEKSLTTIYFVDDDIVVCFKLSQNDEDNFVIECEIRAHSESVIKETWSKIDKLYVQKYMCKN